MTNPIRLPNLNVEVDAACVKGWMNILSDYIYITENTLNELVKDPIGYSRARYIEKEVRKQDFKSLYLGMIFERWSPREKPIYNLPFVMLPKMGRKFEGLITRTDIMGAGKVLQFFEGSLERDVRLAFGARYSKDGEPFEYDGKFDRMYGAYIGKWKFERDPECCMTVNGSFWLKEVSRKSPNLIKNA